MTTTIEILHLFSACCMPVTLLQFLGDYENNPGYKLFTF